MFKQRLRILFTKEGLKKFLGHHDLMRLFERALRRAGLPLAYSAGFNPRPRISFPLAIALGYESREELCEVELVRWVAPRGVKEKLEEILPEGIGVTSVEAVPFRTKAEVTGTSFAVEMDAPPPDFAAKLECFMGGREAFLQRNTKSGVKDINVRPMVDGTRFDGRTLHVDLKVTSHGTVRPTEVVEAVLQCPPDALPAMRVTRTRLHLAPPP